MRFASFDGPRNTARTDNSSTTRAATQTVTGAAYDIVDVYSYDALDRLIVRQNYRDATHPTPLSTTGSPAVVQTYSYTIDTVTNTDAWVETHSTIVGPAVVSQTKRHSDQFGQIRKVADVYGGQIAGVDWVEATAEYGYFGDGRLSSSTRQWLGQSGGGSNLQNTLYAYDDAGRLNKIDHDVDNATLLDYAYQYDQLGRISQVTPTAGGSYVSAFGAFGAESHGYDETGQLTSSGSESFTYDLNGNRTDGAFTPAENNRIASDADYTYQYDNEGNVVRRDNQADSGYALYAWDNRNRLTRFEEYAANGTTQIAAVDYRYNASDELVARDSETFVTADGRRAMIIDAADNVTQRYVYGAMGEVLFDQRLDPAGGDQTDLLMPVADHAGSTVAVLDDALTLLETIDYAPFGEIDELRELNVGTGSYDLRTDPAPADLDTVFGYHGRAYDPDSGLGHHAARWYDPRSGRFLSEDPIAADVNPYRFAGNDPINYGDPTGLVQAGHPLDQLAGGYSGGQVRRPSLQDNIQNFSVATSQIGSWGLNDRLSSSGLGFAATPTRTGSAQSSLQSYSRDVLTTTSNLFGTPNPFSDSSVRTGSAPGKVAAFITQDHQASSATFGKLRGSDAASWTLRSRKHWTQEAAQAIGWGPKTAPQTPFEMNRRITAEYAKMYLRDPSRFVWAGMAAFASHEVGIGMNKAKALREEAGNPLLAFGAVFTGAPTGSELVDALGRGNLAVYADIHWQHLAYSEGGLREMRNLATRGELRADLFEAWKHIDDGRVWEGNRGLLLYEQRVTLQNEVYAPHADAFGYMSRLSELMPSTLRSPIPSDSTTFQAFVPGGDLGNFNDRWKWIDKSMLPAWKQLTQESPAKVRTMMEQFAKQGFGEGE